MSAVLRALSISGLGLLGACATVEPGAVTPQRPTLSSDTNTTVPGTVEWEAGVAAAKGGAFDTPMALKYGVGEGTELFVAGSPYLVVAAPGANPRGASDVTFGARHRFATWEGGTSAAAAASVRVPASERREGLGSGETDLFLAGILSQAFADWGLVLYGQTGFLGEATGSGIDLEHAVAVAAGTALFDDVGGFVEVARVWLPERGAHATPTTVGLTLALDESTVLDTALQLDLDDPDGVTALFGVTWNLGRLRPR